MINVDLGVFLVGIWLYIEKRFPLFDIGLQCIYVGWTSVDDSSRNNKKDEILSIVKSDSKIAAAIDGKTIVKEIVIPGRIINIVVK